MRKIYCDWCNEEINKSGKKYTLNLTDNASIIHYYTICNKCFNKLKLKLMDNRYARRQENEENQQ